MHCHACGTEVRPGQKFCAECGASLRGVADVTGEVPVIRPDPTISESARGEVSEAIGRLERAPSGPPVAGTDETVVVTPAERSTPIGAGSEPDGRRTRVSGVPGPSSPYVPGPAVEERPGRLDPDSMLQPIVPLDRGAPARPAWPSDADATTRLPRQDAPTTVTPAAAYGWIPGEPPAPAADPTTAYARADQGARAPTDHEYVYDERQAGWEQEWPTEAPPRRPRQFRLRLVFVLALLAAGATAVGVASTVIEITPDVPTTLFASGSWMVNDFGTNNTVGALIAIGLLVVGGFLWCFGFRWGAGLAGGGGLALAGWAALLIGLAEWPLRDAEQGAASVTSTISREVGYWGVAAAGALGILAFLTSLGGSGRDASGGLDPWIAALGAASLLVAAGGPLIPLGTADFSGNYSSDTLAVQLPDAFFAGRLTQVGLLAFSGIVGFLLVRRYGLGLAIGGASVAGWLVATAATTQTESPIGLAYANPGATDLRPHAVTIVGMALAGFFALVAVVMALLDASGKPSIPAERPPDFPVRQP